MCAPIRPAAPVTRHLMRLPGWRHVAAYGLPEAVDEAGGFGGPPFRIAGRRVSAGLGRRDVDEAIGVGAVRGAGHGVGSAGEACQQGHRAFADPLQQRHQLFQRWRRRFVHRSPDADVATLHQRLEVRDRPVEEGLVGVRDHSVLQAGDDIGIEHLPEQRQCELLPARDGDPRSGLGPFERGDAVVIPGGSILAQHGLPVQPVPAVMVLDHLQLAHVDRLALIQDQIVGLRQIDVALRLAYRAS